MICQPLFYNGDKILNLLDLNKRKPELFFITSNRNAGKTTYFIKKFVSEFLKFKKTTCYLFRYSYELDGDCVGKIFGGVQELFFSDYIFTQKKTEKGKLVDLYIQKKDKSEPPELIGWAISISDAANIKRFSHKIKCDYIFFDEFQAEFNSYLPDEILKFQSIHKSLARGFGEQVRYLPVILTGNPVTILNPYYTALGISARLNKNVKFLRGNGWVLEQGFNESARDASLDSGFETAFSAAGSDNYSAYAAEGNYFNDSDFGIIKNPGEPGNPIFCIFENDIFYIFENLKKTGKIRIKKSRGAAGQICKRDPRSTGNYPLLSFEQKAILKNLFDNNKICFDSLESKDLIFKILSY